MNRNYGIFFNWYVFAWKRLDLCIFLKDIRFIRHIERNDDTMKIVPEYLLTIEMVSTITDRETITLCALFRFIEWIWFPWVVSRTLSLSLLLSPRCRHWNWIKIIYKTHTITIPNNPPHGSQKERQRDRMRERWADWRNGTLRTIIILKKKYSKLRARCASIPFIRFVFCLFRKTRSKAHGETWTETHEKNNNIQQQNQRWRQRQWR